MLEQATSIGMPQIALWVAASLMVLGALLPLAMTVLNLVSWRRGRPGRPADPELGDVSVLVPARNEQANIERCVRAALNSRQQPTEIIVYSDGSTDGTDDVVRALAAEDHRVKLIQGSTLPSGWVGKPHACQRLYEAARGECLVFVDADVELLAEGMERLLSVLDEPARARVVTALPRQLTKTWFERWILPLLTLTYTAWFPLRSVEWGSDPRFVAANGQLMAVKRSTLHELGGFEPVRSAIVDDMELCRRAKRLGYRVAFADGFCMARCRMYESARQVWEGFSKNLYGGLGSPGVFAFVVGLYSFCFVLPYAALAVLSMSGFSMSGLPAWFDVVPVGAMNGDLLLGAAGLAVSCNLLTRGLLAWRFRQPWEGVVLHPVAVLALLAIAFNSMLWHRRGAIRWAGRVYGPDVLPLGAKR